jgi:hypothetical protein
MKQFASFWASNGEVVCSEEVGVEDLIVVKRHGLTKKRNNGQVGCKAGSDWVAKLSGLGSRSRFFERFLNRRHVRGSSDDKEFWLTFRPLLDCGRLFSELLSVMGSLTSFQVVDVHVSNSR